MATAPGVPILYYHFPTLTHLEYNILELTHFLRRELGEQFVGIKYTATDESEFDELVTIKVQPGPS